MKKALFISIFLLASCQHHIVQREPSSVSVQELYIEKLRISDTEGKIRVLKRRASNYPETEDDKIRSNELLSEAARLEAQLAPLRQRSKRIESEINQQIASTSVMAPEAQMIGFSTAWRQHLETFFVPSLKHFEVGPQGVLKKYFISDSEAQSVEVHLEQQVFTWRKSQYLRDVGGPSQSYLIGEISCRENFYFKENYRSEAYKAGEVARFKWYDSGENGQDPTLYLSNGFTSCDLKFDSPSEDRHYGVQFLPEWNLTGDLGISPYLLQHCILPSLQNLSGVERLFLTADYNSMTCPHSIGNIRTLKDPYDGLNAKVRSLLGYELKKEQIESQNPNLDLDFSKAPHLDAIFISYLVFSNDYSGNLIRRLLEFHASRGAQVRILISDVMQSAKDELMTREMVARNSNIKVFALKYKSQVKESSTDWLSTFHRTMHTKMFLTYSKSEPQNNLYIVGGRNIHDGFVFATAPDMSQFPDLTQYGKDGRWAQWEDFDIEIRDSELTKQMMAHFFTYYLWDRETMFVRSINFNSQVPLLRDNYFKVPPGHHLVRHLLTFPYVDDMALEKFYINLIDSSEKTIHISSPYFRPTEKITEALLRAVKRGVHVTLITRLALKGDTAGAIISDVNKAGINQFLGKIRIFEYVAPERILHSKIVLVDGKLVVLGSVNLYQRGFYHDSENALLIYSPEFHERMEAVYKDYLSRSREITEKLRISFWKQVIIDTFSKEF